MSILEAETYHQRQLFSKFSKIENFDPTYGARFRLPLSVACSDFLIRGRIEMCLTYKNTGLRNERVRFEQFAVEHPSRPIAVACHRWQNPPGAVLLYKLNALRAI